MLGLGIQFLKVTLRSENDNQLYMDSNSHCSHIFCFVVFFLKVFPQFYQQYETYPFWSFIPQYVEHITPESVINIAKPIAPKTAEETKVWW